MKLAILHPSFARSGGAERLTAWMSLGLARRGHEVTLFTPAYDDSLWSKSFAECVEVRILKERWLDQLINSNRFRNRSYAKQIADDLEKFDLIVASGHPSHLWVAKAKQVNPGINVPVIWYCQDLAPRIYWKVTDRHLINYYKFCGNPNFNLHFQKVVENHKRFPKERKRRREMSSYRNAIRSIDLILANSLFCAENIQEALGVPAKVCYPGIPGKGVSAKAQEPLGEYLAVVSPLRLRKNIHNVIEAFSILLARQPKKKIILKIIGDGLCRQELENLAREKGVLPQIKFTGWLSGGELREAYRGARLCIYIPIDEAFGLAAIEAMSYGIPPIVSDHAGVSEIVIHGETGLLVNPFDPIKIADAIDGLWDDEEKIRKMGAAGRRRVEAQFTQRHFLDRLEAFLQQNDKLD